jgi:Glycosyl hydrolases family 2, TIM barrel domain/Glycosyl hydrolases family 2
MTMLTYPRMTALAATAACVTIAATALAAEAPPPSRLTVTASPGEPTAGAGEPTAGAGEPTAGAGEPTAGAGGRTALTRWTLRRDPADRGRRLGWRRGGFSGAAVSVPNVVQSRPYSGPVGTRNYEGSVAWYRTTVRAPRAGVYALAFTSANFTASVWIDGRALGSHRGSYLPFELRTTLAAGTHTLVVRVDWRNPSAHSRLGFHRTWFNWGGLNGPVSVRAIGASELSGATVQTVQTLTPSHVVCVRAPCPELPAVRTATVEISAQVRNDSASGRAIAVEGTLARGAQTIPLSFPPQRLDHGQTATVSTAVIIPDAALWSPASPSLYQLTLAVGHESSFSARVGLRQLTWQGGRIYLNGERLLLHGASIQQDAPGHGDALTPGDEDAIVRELQAIGANAARAQHPLDPALLERLDAAGILVWQGIGPVEGAGNWYPSTPALLAEAERQARTAALAAQLHPSIIAWNLVDEVAENGRNAAEVAYVRSLTRWLHAHDPTRIVAVDVWGDHPPRHPGALYREVDAVAETDYSGWYDSPRNSPAAVSAEIRRRLAAMRRTFAGKVLAISEFGAESNGLNPPGSPGSYAFQSRLLERHITAYAADPQLSGMFVWVLRDYPLTPTFKGGSIHSKLPGLRLIEGLNQKGLFTYGGRAKPAVGVVARLFRALPGT